MFPEEIGHPGLMYGDSGIALCLGFIWSKTNDDGVAHRALDHLKKAYRKASKNDTSLGSGLAGIALTFRLLISFGLIKNDDISILKKMDELITNSIRNDLKNSNHDFLFGALGKIHYLYWDNCLNGSYSSDLLIDIHDYFLNNLVATNRGMFWSNSPGDQFYNGKNYNLGLAHGQSLIIYFLAKTLFFNTKQNRLKEIVNEACNGIIANKLKNGISYFSNYSDHNRSTKTSWCGGDIGIIYGLLAGYEVTGNKETLNEAISAVKFNASRQLNESLLKRSKNIVETNLCHGILSPTILFWLSHERFSCEEVKSANQYWQEQFFKSIRLEVPLQFNYASKKWEKVNGLLSGIAGIAFFMSGVLFNDMTVFNKLFLLEAFQDPSEGNPKN
ncbi:lanthionine synthetase LanC family protein [Ekhidna sp.]|uniref:lanthionine synthetase LanC family protein n=1 Tax=Ekhidna sp. TaxID=2608089 RepID=UPI003CCBD1D1